LAHEGAAWEPIWVTTNVALTFRAFDIFAELEHAPDQAEKLQPLTGVAMAVIALPEVKFD
jgi:hypothetical protein